MRIGLCVLFLAGLATLAGCADAGNAARPSTHPVKGTVTYAGAPLADATVTFTAKDGSRSAFGRTDAEGRFTLTTFSGGDGAAAGDYEVAIVKFDAPTQAEEFPEDDPNYTGPTSEDSAPPKSLIPAKYGTAKTSGLTATVSSDGANEFSFSLVD